MHTLAVLNERLADISAQALHGADVGDPFLQLASDARALPGAAALACRCYANAALQFIRHNRPLHAAAAIRQLRSLGRTARMPEQEATASLLDGILAFESGRHSLAVDRLVTLAGTRHGKLLPPTHQLLLLRWLSLMCLPVDAGDSVDLCIALAHRAWAGQEAPMPLPWLVAEASLRLQQYVWSDTVFQGRLRRLELAPPLRAQLLQAARTGLGTARRAAGAGERQNQLVTQFMDDVAEGLHVESPARVRQALTAIDLMDTDSMQASMMVLVASALAMLGDIGATAQVMERMGSRMAALRWNEEVELRYLRSVVAGGRGNTQGAMDAYRDYAITMSGHMGRMELHVKQALRRLTELPGGRPEDRPGAVPAYLRRAIEMLGDAAMHHDVGPLARAVGVSERTLRSAFQVHCGKPPKAYIRDLRLDAARRHLEAAAATPPTVAELAERFGFSHPGRFAAAYRARHGVPPAGRRA